MHAMTEDNTLHQAQEQETQTDPLPLKVLRPNQMNVKSHWAPHTLVCPWLLSVSTYLLDTEDSSPIVSKLILVQNHRRISAPAS